MGDVSVVETVWLDIACVRRYADGEITVQLGYSDSYVERIMRSQRDDYGVSRQEPGDDFEVGDC